jgi:hypothetical protein
MVHLTKENLVSELLFTLPELRGRTLNLLWPKRLLHLLFGVEVVPLVISRLEDHADEDFLRRAFQFFERMAESADADVHNIVGVSVCEPLFLQRMDRLELAQPYLGEQTVAVYHDVVRYWKRLGVLAQDDIESTPHTPLGAVHAEESSGEEPAAASAHGSIHVEGQRSG